jgi:hypothetical protein
MSLQDIAPRTSPAEAFIKVTPPGSNPVVYPWADPSGGDANATNQYWSADFSTVITETIGHHNAGQELTFEAIISRIPTNEIVAVRWDMGDGTTKYGQTIAHTYRVTAADILVTVAVTDMRGQTVHAGRQMYLNKYGTNSVLARRIVMHPSP